MAESNKEYRKVYREMWYVLNNKEPNRGSSKETNSEWSARETMNIFNSRLHHKVTISSRKGHNCSSI